MNTETSLWNIVENMPDSLKIELLHYAEYLTTKTSTIEQLEEKKQAKNEKNLTEKKPLAGSMKGTFVLPLADNFDDPLEESEDYL